VTLRERFVQYVVAHPQLELAAPPSLALCCFRLVDQGDEAQMAFLRRINADGKCFIIHSKLGGRVILRLACGGLEQRPEDIDMAWSFIRAAIPA
jgi:aromatic-L-amino-acid decarboxylase